MRCRTGRRAAGACAVLPAVVVLLAGCGGGRVQEAATGPGDAGLLAFSLQFEPVAAVGAFELSAAVTRAGGAPLGTLSSCALEVAMPSMSHGAAGTPSVAVEGTNCVLRGLSFQMPGRWLVRVEAVTDAGSDAATFAVVVR